MSTSSSAAPLDVALARTGVGDLYGGPELRQRADLWAVQRGYRLSGTFWPCAHGLLRRGRRWPCGCDRLSGMLDHASVWLHDGRPAVLLAHTYLGADEATHLAHDYARGHGLVVVIGDDADAWYGFGTTPLRFELPVIGPR